jgi:hypothetical protein
MAEDIVPRFQRSRDRQRPLPALTDKFLARPHLARVVDAFSLDLDPLQVRLDDLGAVAVARRDVSQDRAVRVRPRVGPPGERETAAGFDGRRGGAGRRVLVAVDVGGLVGAGRDEAYVEVLGVPGGDGGEGAAVYFLVVVVHWDGSGRFCRRDVVVGEGSKDEGVEGRT